MKMRCWSAVLLLVVGLALVIDAKKKSTSSRSTKEDATPSPPSKTSTASTPSPPPPASPSHNEDSTIEDVDEDKIDEIIHDGTKHLVILFYDGRSKCPGCAEALSELEEIDDDLEATGYIEVVKTDDRNVARELGVTTFPSLVYFRRKNPIIYDGDFKDSEAVLRWVRSHDEVVAVDLDDDDFEDRTDSHSPDEGALDWFIMFYDSKDAECNAFVPVWEAVAHRLRGQVHVGRVDSSEDDDVTERFRIDDSECPTFLLFHRGKMYRYKETAKDVKSFVQFALHKFKEQRGHRVPDPPTALEEFYEELKEEVLDLVQDHRAVAAVGVAGVILIVTLTLAVKAYRIRNQKPKSS